MQDIEKVRAASVHCRIGSLEILIFTLCLLTAVHCRIGSLER